MNTSTRAIDQQNMQNTTGLMPEQIRKLTLIAAMIFGSYGQLSAQATTSTQVPEKKRAGGVNAEFLYTGSDPDMVSVAARGDVTAMKFINAGLGSQTPVIVDGHLGVAIPLGIDARAYLAGGYSYNVSAERGGPS